MILKVLLNTNLLNIVVSTHNFLSDKLIVKVLFCVNFLVVYVFQKITRSCLILGEHTLVQYIGIFKLYFHDLQFYFESKYISRVLNFNY